MINTPTKYKESKLSKLVELQTRELLEQETQEEFELVKKENLQLSLKIKAFQTQLDSLKLKKEVIDTIKIDDICLVFFNTSTINIKEESKNTLKSWMVQKQLNQTKSLKFYITGYSDLSGDSLINVQLANDRAIYMKYILAKEYCIEDSLISITSQANIKTCKKDLYRSVKIQSF
jgi:outer membrane protein OmpA-like peptidoglycan-associated protein